MYACADSACFVALEPDLELLGSAWLGSPQLRCRGKKPSATAAAEISLRENALVFLSRKLASRIW